MISIFFLKSYFKKIPVMILLLYIFCVGNTVSLTFVFHFKNLFTCMWWYFEFWYLNSFLEEVNEPVLPTLLKLDSCDTVQCIVEKQIYKSYLIRWPVCLHYIFSSSKYRKEVYVQVFAIYFYSVYKTLDFTRLHVCFVCWFKYTCYCTCIYVLLKCNLINKCGSVRRIFFEIE